MKSKWKVPADEECFLWWERFAMLSHIREHSLLVAEVATRLAKLARGKGLSTDIQAVRASALLHDLGKTYSIAFGGNHCQIGGALVQELTKNPAISQGVVHHVWWPGEPDPKCHFLILAVLYADKRVKHTEVVSLRQRYNDILDRYGATPPLREKIDRSFHQVKEVEVRMSNLLEMDLQCECF